MSESEVQMNQTFVKISVMYTKNSQNCFKIL